MMSYVAHNDKRVSYVEILGSIRHHQIRQAFQTVAHAAELPVALFQNVQVTCALQWTTPQCTALRTAVGQDVAVDNRIGGAVDRCGQ